MKKIARGGQAITFLNMVDVADEVAAGQLRHLPVQEIGAHLTSLKLLVGGHAAASIHFRAFVVEELRKAMPRLEAFDAGRDWRDGLRGSAIVEMGCVENERSFGLN